MKALQRRIERLEQIRSETESVITLILMQSGAEFALSTGECVAILRDCGYGPDGGIWLVNLGDVPDGLGVRELEQYLRAHASEICGSRTMA